MMARRKQAQNLQRKGSECFMTLPWKVCACCIKCQSLHLKKGIFYMNHSDILLCGSTKHVNNSVSIWWFFQQDGQNSNYKLLLSVFRLKKAGSTELLDETSQSDSAVSKPFFFLWEVHKCYIFLKQTLLRYPYRLRTKILKSDPLSWVIRTVVHDVIQEILSFVVLRTGWNWT